jgi:phosphomannomutase
MSMPDLTLTDGFRLRSSADGWRGVIGDGFSPEATAALARCVAECVSATQPVTTTLVTYDGRGLGEPAAHAVAHAVQNTIGGQVRLVPYLPTPTATAAVRLGHADLALLVTASHNPPSWNGLKVKVRPGCPPPGEVERAIADRYEAHDARPDQPVAFEPGGWQRDLIAEHIGDVLGKLAVPPAKRLRVVVDGLGGVACGPVARLCAALSWDACPLGRDLDPEFNGLVPDPSIPASRARAAEAVVAQSADLGLVLDGDGDRLYVIDHLGRTVHPHELLALLFEHRHWKRYGSPERGVAVTSSTGMAVRLAADWIGAPVRELGVGFKHLSPVLAAGQADVAGGSVGDLAFAEYGIDRDPFAAVALLADMLAADGTLAERLDDLRARVGPLTWFESRVPGSVDGAVLLQAGMAALSRSGLRENLTEIGGTDGIKFWLDRGQWLLLRPSSTEGGLRIYGELLETPSAGLVETIHHFVVQK